MISARRIFAACCLGLGCSPTLELGSDLGPGVEGTDASAEMCEDLPAGFDCLACAQTDCCDEIRFCSNQDDCDCFERCLSETGDPMQCAASCDPSSGMAAIMSCLAMACGGACANPPGQDAGTSDPP